MHVTHHQTERMIDQPKTGVSEVEKALAVVKNDAMSIVVTDAPSYEMAAKMLIKAKAQIKWIEDYWEDDIANANALHKSLVQKRKQMCAIIEPVVSYLDRGMFSWRQAEEKKRRDAELKAQAEAKRIADEQALREAQELEKTGRPEEAAAVIERAEIPPPAFIPSSVPKVDGVSVRKIQKFRIINRAAIRAEFMIPDEVAIGKVVKSLGKNAEKIIGGIEVYEDESTATSSR